MFSPIEAIELIIVYQCLLVGVWVARRSQLMPLSGLNLVFGLHMAANIGFDKAWLPAAWNITSAFGLLYGPWLYLLIRQLCQTDRPLKWRDTIHFLPALVIVLWRPSDPVPQIIGLPLLLAYLGLCYRLLHQHSRLVAQWRADAVAVDLSWVYRVFYAFLVIAAIDLSRFWLAPLLSPIGWQLHFALVISAVLVLLSYLTSKAIAHERRHGGLNQEQTLNLQHASDTQKDHPELTGVFHSIDTAIREQEWWRKPRLTLAFIADNTGYSIRDVSRAINTQSSDSFSTYINRMRIDAFDQMFINDSNNASVLDVALAVGFNAKSTFNRVYRQIRGKAPTRH